MHVPLDPKSLRISDFSYHLPPERIALHPLPQRDAAKLLHYRPGQPIRDRTFRDLPELLPLGSLLVFNDTRVVPARVLFQRETGAWIELFCLRPATGGVDEAMQQTGQSDWICLAGNSRRWKPDEVLRLQLPSLALEAQHVQGHNGEGKHIRFVWQPAQLSFAEVLTQVGQVPLPPYLHRPPVPDDLVRYQTVYAQQPGAVAAPTAGLHFTDAVLADLAQREVASLHLTLHVGAGTFQPVSAETMAGHNMHAEEALVPRSVIADLAMQLDAGKPVIAVGTTSMRTLESLYWAGRRLLLNPSITPGPLLASQWEPYEGGPMPSPGESLHALLTWMARNDQTVLRGDTQLLIAPGYPMQVVSGLVTNFHQPNSTLLLLVAALVGDAWRDIYQHALDSGYRFLSFGDSSLLLRQ